MAEITILIKNAVLNNIFSEEGLTKHFDNKSARVPLFILNAAKATDTNIIFNIIQNIFITLK